MFFKHTGIFRLGEIGRISSWLIKSANIYVLITDEAGIGRWSYVELG